MATRCASILQHLQNKFSLRNIEIAQGYCEKAAPYITFRNIALAYLGYAIIKFFVLAIYRITFHPLASFPGPWLAKISPLYEMYYAICKDGAFTKHCHEILHPKYGPIVRTMPDVLRVSDPEAFHQIHYVGTPFTKLPSFYLAFKAPKSNFGAVDPKYHRIARSNLSPMFSKAAVKKHEPVTMEKAGLLLDRYDQFIDESGGRQALIPAKDLYYAYAYDIIADYAFAGQDNILKSPVIDHPFFVAMSQAGQATVFNRYFPLILNIMERIPLYIIHKIVPSAIGHEGMRQSILKEVLKLDAKRKSGELKDTRGSKVTVLSELMDKGLPIHDVLQEAHTLVGGALDTSAWALQTVNYYLAADKSIQLKLHNLLKEASPDNRILTWSEAESIPYLGAIIKETLRIATGFCGAMSRVSPPNGITILGQHIPGNINVDSDIHSIHHNARIFPEPERFNPERWLAPGSKQLERYLVPFSAGTRGCVGLNFAWMNLYIGIAAIFRNYEIDLTEEMRKEGWLWTEKTISTKRGQKAEFLIRRRD